MRNLKRALSLAVASVMLLGMMIVGTGAVSVNDFGDADQIASENLEAATITTGLGLFAGADGNFLPDEPVTRAQMATIICKMLYGNDVNADNFKGVGTFQDTANFESGWAEGYINMCASLGIVSGYNETTYGPGDTVTTWQASLMLQRALGYWNPAAGEEINELTVTTKGTQLGFYGDLTLSANEPLAREDVAVMAFNALFAQRVSYNVDRNVYVKANDFSIAVTNGTEDEMNTLAQNTFGMYVVEGVVAANGTTNAMLAEDNNTGAKTNVIFDEPVDVDRDGRATDLDYDFIYGTDMDMIGHAAKVYYKIVRNAPEVYAITDNAVKVETVTSGSSFSATVREAGFNRNTANTEVVRNYSLTDTKTYEDDLTTILISNSSDLTVDYAIQLEQTVDYVRYVTVRDDGYDKAYSYYLEAAGTKGVDVTGQQAMWPTPWLRATTSSSPA